MAKHTPGPWKAGLRTVTAPETEERLGLDVRLYGGNSDDNKANARLIAAAPDLLEALRGFVEEKVDYMQINKLGDPEQTHMVKWARAVIAKATGRPA